MSNVETVPCYCCDKPTSQTHPIEEYWGDDVRIRGYLCRRCEETVCKNCHFSTATTEDMYGNSSCESCKQSKANRYDAYVTTPR